MTSPASRSSTGVTPGTLAAAAEHRARISSSQPSATQLAAEHDKKQKFRRLIDPGILRQNPKDQAMASLKTLLTIAENLLREPENPKFQQFKPTNTIVKRNLMDPKGALEYAIELGFHPEVQDLQPYYVFHKRRMTDLRMGTVILHDAVQLETEKAERASRLKVNEKALTQAMKDKVKMAYIDDRQTQMIREQRERQQRAAQELAGQIGGTVHEHESLAREGESPSPLSDMPGSGQVLGAPDSL